MESIEPEYILSDYLFETLPPNYETLDTYDCLAEQPALVYFEEEHNSYPLANASAANATEGWVEIEITDENQPTGYLYGATGYSVFVKLEGKVTIVALDENGYLKGVCDE